ncbi:MAG: SHOCT domain-containing protein [Pseudomonadaceae bacterium]|nr:SHOCT domain-containing protein [Pseudomonadaceae bacterium]
MTASTDTTCPKCQSSNPVGAKFCSSCRNPLKAAPGPGPTPPPPPPPRPGPGGMLGGLNGKTANKQFSGDPDTIYAHLANEIHSTEGAEVQQQVPPQQISAKMPFKSLGTTIGQVIKVDTIIAVTPVSPGQCQVSITSKTDASTTGSVWAYSLAIWFLIVFLWGFAPFMIIVALAACGFGWWTLQSSPGEKISKGLFDMLAKNAGVAAPTPNATPSPSPQQAPPAQPQAAPPPSPAASEDEIFDRIRKLAELKEAGAITEADFEAKKADLLERL